jgi:hypothetical protein
MGCNKRIKSKMRKMYNGGTADYMNMQNQTDNIASKIPVWGQFYSAGKAVDKSLWDRDPETGAFNSDLAAAASYGITDPAQSLKVARDEWKKGQYGQAALSMLVPAYAGIKAQREAEKEQTRLDNQKELLRKQQQFGQQDLTPGQDVYTPLMPYGGAVGHETVELEKGEPYRLPDGTIEQVSTEAPTHAQGGVVMDLPVGTQVLGKKKAVNGKQFKELGRKLKKAQDKYDKALENNPTSLATKTSKRMLDNIDKEYSKLFNEQGVDVYGQGGKVKYKNGGKIRKGQTGLTAASSPENILAFQRYAGIADDSIWGPQTSSAWEALGSDYTRSQQGLPVAQSITPTSVSSPNVTAPVLPTSIPTTSTTFNAPTATTGTGTQLPNTDWQNITTTVGTLAPTAYNLIQGMRPAEQVDARTLINPRAAEGSRLMRDRRYNVQPEIEAGERTSATLRRNLREAGLSKGQLMGGYQQAALAETRNKSQALARKQNIENQYKADLAAYQYRRGAEEAATERYVQDINARNRAARRAMTAQGLSQISNLTQRNQLQRNLKERDMQRMRLLPAYMPNYQYSPNTGITFN